MSKYKEIIGSINYGLFLVLTALLPFPQVCLRYAFVVWFIFWVLEGRWLKKPDIQLHVDHLQFVPSLLFGLWFVWKVVSVCWAPDYNAWAWQMERYMSFGLIIPVGLWGVNERYNLRQAGKVLAISWLDGSALSSPRIGSLSGSQGTVDATRGLVGIPIR